MKILAVGGAGKVGSVVVSELVNRQADVRVLVRKLDSSLKSQKEIEYVEGDLLDPTSVNNALDGIDKLYLLNAVSPDELTQGLIAYDLAKQRKVRQVVYHSVFRAEHFKDVPHFAPKLTIERALREFDLPFTVIRPNYFFQNDDSVRESLTKKRVYPAPLGQRGISAVDIRDIAEATAIVLTESGGHDGMTYNLNGPELLSGPGAAAIWSELLGMDIRYGGDNLDNLETQMFGKIPAWRAFDIRMMFQGYLERGFEAEPGDIETLTGLLGHPPRSYWNFAQELAQSWKQ